MAAGCYNSKIVSISLVFVLSLIISFACPTTPLLTHANNFQPCTAPPGSVLQTDDYSGRRIKNSAPHHQLFLNSNNSPRKNKNEKGNYDHDLSSTSKNNKHIMKRKRINNLDARRFSAMLPKGYVPPSGSSPCHNVYPNSVTFFCDLSDHQIRQP
ncbi:hypothetical protein Sango_1410800 [Sesamum angolense]|uniref:Transmembrane protein n=1 Tax=Sesamum angolense TaxID=2727404 RepID=A0AAE1WTG3_9LAMI|nr:hypothetical protein Sango_1410800 [Sesamum angolense]